MPHSVNKLNHNRPLLPLNSEMIRQAAKLHEVESRSLIELIVDHYRDIPQAQRPLNEAQHEVLRRKLFHRLVSQTLSQPGNPFAGLKGRIREDMIAAITEELVHSHYQI